MKTAPLICAQSSEDTYTVAANGRVPTGSGTKVIYIISPTKFLTVDVDPTHTTPGITVGERWHQSSLSLFVQASTSSRRFSVGSALMDLPTLC